MSHRSPCQTSMFGLRQDRSTLLMRASNQTTRPASTGSTLVRERVEAERAGQVVHAEVEPAAGLEQLLDLLVGLAEPDDGVELHLHQPRDPQSQPPGQVGRR